MSETTDGLRTALEALARAWNEDARTLRREHGPAAYQGADTLDAAAVDLRTALAANPARQSDGGA